jgi:hypothetical protein
MGWHVGDLGRFTADDPKKGPTFEVMSASQAGIVIKGSSFETTVPVKTFAKDCVKSWVLSVSSVNWPKWVCRGARFTMDLCLESKSGGWTASETSNSIGGQRFKLASGVEMSIRRIQCDYLSCDDRTHNTFRFVPVSDVLLKALPVLTRAQMIQDLDLFGK